MNETGADDTAALGGPTPRSLPAERSRGTTASARTINRDARMSRLPQHLRGLVNHPAIRASDSHMLPSALNVAADEIEYLRDIVRDAIPLIEGFKRVTEGVAAWREYGIAHAWLMNARVATHGTESGEPSPVRKVSAEKGEPT
jgi:hypothetical protein